jgi:hypothetical protein
VNTLDLSRWQFGITTVFHFIFVPLTIGLALLLAIMQTTAYKNRRDPVKYDKWSKNGNLLAPPLSHQLCHWGGHRHRRGVPVRNELGRLFTLRRLGVRGSPGDRGPIGLLSWSPHSSESGSSARTACRHESTWRPSGSSAQAPCSRLCSSWPPTPGCNIPSATRSKAIERS